MIARLCAFLVVFWIAGSQAHLVNPPPSVGDSNLHVDIATQTQTASITNSPQQPDFAFDIENLLPVSATTSVTFLTSLPDNCSPYLTSECSSTMAAAQVTYDDCGTSWTVCRCTNANMTMEDIVDKLGRVPVGLRRYVGTVVVLPDDSPHAYTLTNGDVHIFGQPQIETWLHEATHAFDYKTSSPISGTEGWLSSVQNDTCVPDNYSQTNAIEDFAQVSVLKFYQMTHDGALPDGFDNECMRYQLAFMDSLPIFNTKTLFGNTCAIKDASGAGIDMNVGAKNVTPPKTLVTKTFPITPVPTATSSGFRKVVASATGAVQAAAAGPTSSNSATGHVGVGFMVGIAFLSGLLVIL